jgi:hypothetical protein
MTAVSDLRSYLLGRPPVAALVDDGGATDGYPWLFVKRLDKTQGMPRMAVVLRSLPGGSTEGSPDQRGALSWDRIEIVSYGADIDEADRLDEAVVAELDALELYGDVVIVTGFTSPWQRYDDPPGWEYVQRQCLARVRAISKEETSG